MAAPRRPINIDRFITQSGEWLRGSGPEGDIVVSSRVRLARNLNRFPFLTIATPIVRREIEEHVRGQLDEILPKRGMEYLPLSRLAPLDRQLLVERHLISREHAAGEGERGVALSSDESASIMVNEEDHLRLQVIRSGLQLDEAWSEIDQLDTVLEERLHYAFHSKYGYLTCCPTNAGTGMRISVLLHLPAVLFSKQLEKVLQSLQRLNYSIRGLFGEGTSPIGDLFQVSNQITLGRSEEDLLRDLKRVIPEVLKFERSWRRKLLHEEPVKLHDKVWRAYGVLKNARRISSEETMELLSALRLGCNLGIVEGVPLKALNELFIFTQPAHLQKIEQKLLESEDRDRVRADFIRKHLPSI